MRRTAWLGVALTACLAGAAEKAQEPKVLYTATVSANEVEVRSGPGDAKKLYATNLLVKGNTVEVVQELEGGWLAIKPPRGSFSWINSRFVQCTSVPLQHYAVVAYPNTKVPLLLGSNIRTDKPTVEGVKVGRGTQLRAIGPMKLAQDGYWLPVEPTAMEVRYLRAEAVSRKGSETVAGTVPAAAPPGLPGTPPDPAGPPGFNNPIAPTAPPASPATPPGTHPLWTRAQQAEQAGQYQEAIRLYEQLGAEATASNHALSVQAYNRAQNLSDALARRPPSRPPLSSPGEPAAASTSRMAPAPQGMVSSGAGWLRRAGRTLDYSTLYVLEDSRGIPILYATAQAGFSLETYANRNVELIGNRLYRNDLRAYHMTVMQIRPLR